MDNILVVDDEPQIRRLLQQYLERLGLNDHLDRWIDLALKDGSRRTEVGGRKSEFRIEAFMNCERNKREYHRPNAFYLSIENRGLWTGILCSEDTDENHDCRR